MSMRGAIALLSLSAALAFGAGLSVRPAFASAADAFRDGLLALDRGDLASARASLEQASKSAPDNGRVWIALAQVYWRLHDNSESEAAAKRASSLGANDAAVTQGLAIFYGETQRPLLAARAQAKLAALQPENRAARERIATLYFEAAQPLLDAQNFAEAESVLKEGLAKTPDDAQLDLALGVSRYGLRRFDEAADAFLRTIDLAPQIEQPYQFLGKILDQIPDRLPVAAERFAQYEAAHPDRAEGYLLHAKALNAQSIDPETVLQLIEKSLSIDASNASGYFERGIALDELARYADAAAAFARATELAPSDAAAHYRLARDYDRTGKHDAAEAERAKHAQLIHAQEIVR